MKKQLKAALAAALALIMALAMIPTSALPRFDAKAEDEPYWTVPSGYNEHDYNKCAAFLEQTDENGVKNGEKLSSSYDPNDPETWIADTFSIYNEDKMDTYFDRESSYFELPFELLGSETVTIGIAWEEDGEYSGDGLKRVDSIIFPAIYALYYAFDCENPYLNDESSDWDFAGSMDFSGMEKLYTFFAHEVYGMGYSYGEAINSIDLSNCGSLTAVGCVGCTIAELNIDGDEYVNWLNCAMTFIENGLDLSSLSGDEPYLSMLDITDMGLTSIEFPSIGIDLLQTYGNYFDTLDLSPLTYLNWFILDNGPDWDRGYEGLQQITYLDRVCRVEGAKGYIQTIEYKCDDNEDIVYTDLISAHCSDGDVSTFIGWFDENGELITEEETLHFDEGSAGEFVAKFTSNSAPVVGDIDGDDEVNTMDALVLLRYVMELPDSDDIIIENSDVNNDGVIDLYDVLLVLRMALDS